MQLATKFEDREARRRPGSAACAATATTSANRSRLSLGRLGTDRIDLLPASRETRSSLSRKTVGALKAELIDEGKVLHPVCRKRPAAQIRRAAGASDRGHSVRWSVVSCDVERFIVPSAKEHGVGFVSYSTLITKWLASLLNRRPRRRRYAAQRFRATPANLATTNRSSAGSCRSQMMPGEAAHSSALAWFLQQRDGNSLAGPCRSKVRFPERVAENLAAVEVELSTRADQTPRHAGGPGSRTPLRAAAAGLLPRGE